jgi:hypothetical protein
MSSLVDDVYVSDSGYSTVTSPKSTSSYDWTEKRHKKNPSFTFDDLKNAEKEYGKFVKGLKTLGLNNVVHVKQVKDKDRIAVIYFVGKNADYLVNNFMTFHLQKGVIYNLPVNKMRKTSGKPLTRMNFDDFNKGISVKASLSVMKRFLSHMEKQCASNDVEFSNDIKTLSLFGLSGKFVYDVKLWSEFLDAGLSPLEVSFGLSKDLNPKWQDGVFNVTPDIAKGLSDVPAEWVRNLLIG